MCAISLRAMSVMSQTRVVLAMTSEYKHRLGFGSLDGLFGMVEGDLDDAFDCVAGLHAGAGITVSHSDRICDIGLLLAD
jgi:hypothetical protein